MSKGKLLVPGSKDDTDSGKNVELRFSDGAMEVAVSGYAESGTTAERDATYPTPTGGETWDNTTLGYREYYNAASAQWEKDLQITGGAVNVTDPALTFVKYSGDGYTYLCQAAIGSARSDAVWRIIRKTDVTGDMVYGGTGAFDLAATDLATVALHTYTLGA